MTLDHEPCDQLILDFENELDKVYAIIREKNRELQQFEQRLHDRDMRLFTLAQSGYHTTRTTSPPNREDPLGYWIYTVTEEPDVDPV